MDVHSKAISVEMEETRDSGTDGDVGMRGNRILWNEEGPELLVGLGKSDSDKDRTSLLDLLNRLIQCFL